MTDYRLSPERRDRIPFVLALVLVVLAGEVAVVFWRAW